MPACGQEDNREVKSTSGVSQTSVSVQTGTNRLTTEQRNVRDRLAEHNKPSYNSLAADYNSQMAKFNWRFANKGDLPPGATDPLPREFKPYVSN